MLSEENRIPHGVQTNTGTVNCLADVSDDSEGGRGASGRETGGMSGKYRAVRALCRTGGKLARYSAVGVGDIDTPSSVFGV